MNICRLCGCEKSSDELVISLQEDIGSISFKEFVEYYCRITLELSVRLPTKVCLSCKSSLVKFSEFSYSVEKQQLKFENKETESNDCQFELITDCNETPKNKRSFVDVSAGYETFESAEFEESVGQEKQKKAKLDETGYELLDEVRVCDEYEAPFANEKPRRQRRKSVFIEKTKEKPKIEVCTQLIDNLPATTRNCQSG